MLDTVDAGLARVRAEAEDELPLPEGTTSLHFMQAIYRDPRQPMTRRMNAARAALPFEHPKLAVITTNHSFAAEMKTIARDRYPGGNVIDHRAEPKRIEGPPPEAEAKPPAVPLFRRRM